MGSTWSGRTVGEDPDPLYVVPSSRDLERAIASVTGVATAQVRPADDGRDRLRISLEPSADPEVVAWAVAATLRERFGIALDPATITVCPPAPPATAAPPAPPLVAPSPDGFAGDPDLVAAARAALGGGTPRDGGDAPRRGGGTPYDGAGDAPQTPGDARSAISADGGPDRAGDVPHAPPRVPEAERATDEVAVERPRPSRRPTPSTGATPPVAAPAATNGARRRAAIADLIARADGEALAVAATLRLAGREVTGRAEGLGTRRGRWRAIATATLTALSELTDGLLRADVDHVTVLAFPDLSHVTVSVTLVGEHGEERYLGAALVRDDADRAVMRATLDAVNRRVEPWLVDRPA